MSSPLKAVTPSLFVALFATGALLASPATAQQQSDGSEVGGIPCPVPTGEARKLAHRFFEAPEFADNRQTAGVTDLKPEQVQTLGNEAPPAAALQGSGEAAAASITVEPKVCRKLNEKYSSEINSEDAPHQPHYFKVGDRYVVILEPVKPKKYSEDIIMVGAMRSLIVLDEKLNEIKGWSG